jgi:hypothetical protein
VTLTPTLALVLTLAACAGASNQASPAPVDDRTASAAAFASIADVFAHPRCMNCHPAGDSPLVGDDSHPHLMEVTRGDDGRGVLTILCANCHQRQNLVGERLPPGAPDWRLPPASSKMVFQGRTPGELCRQILDPAHNGGHTADEILHHLTDDALVKWGWSPGEGRTPAPRTHAEFAARATEWIRLGGACP